MVGSSLKSTPAAQSLGMSDFSLDFERFYDSTKATEYKESVAPYSRAPHHSFDEGFVNTGSHIIIRPDSTLPDRLSSTLPPSEIGRAEAERIRLGNSHAASLDPKVKSPVKLPTRPDHAKTGYLAPPRRRVHGTGHASPSPSASSRENSALPYEQDYCSTVLFTVPPNSWRDRVQYQLLELDQDLVYRSKPSTVWNQVSFTRDRQNTLRH
jgi:hypothetical protein